MTPRERLFGSLNREPVDRVPVWLLFPYHEVSYYDDFRAFAPGQMRATVQQLLAESAGHLFILSPTAGPPDRQLPRVSRCRVGIRRALIPVGDRTGTNVGENLL